MTVDIRQVYTDAGQGHLFEHWNELSTQEQANFIDNLRSISKRIPVEKLVSDCQDALKLAASNSSAVEEIQPLPASSYESVMDIDPSLVTEYTNLGLNAIRNGEVAVILMAGGQGTRLGSSQPKGCYNIGLPSGKSLFQIQADKLLRLQELAKTDIPISWYIMTSEPTRKATEVFFQEQNYFGLNKAQIRFFNQGTLPAFDIKGRKLLLGSPTELVESPDGNGGLYRAIRDNKIIEDMVQKGIKHVYMYCVDNVLSKLADPVFIGFAIKHNFELATKAVRKRESHEPVGIIATRAGKPCVIEYSEISSELAEAKDANGLLKLRAGNIVNHYYSVDLLRRDLDTWCKTLSYHVAKKKIPIYDSKTKETMKPSEPNGIKLEQFIFDVFPTIDLSKFGCLEVNRSTEFSPLKNGPGSKVDNPTTSREAYLTLGTSWLKTAGAHVSDGVLVEVSNTISYAGENLEQYKGKQYTKDGTIVQ